MENLENQKILIWRAHPNTGKEELHTRVVKNGLVKIDHTFYTIHARPRTDRSYQAEYSHF